jgi:subtilisin family serine protease
MVYWIAPRMKHSLNNFAAGAVVQGSPLAARVSEPSEAGAQGLHPIWEAGLRGEGQIVGIGDSGVDMDSCYFYDPKVAGVGEGVDEGQRRGRGGGGRRRWTLGLRAWRFSRRSAA